MQVYALGFFEVKALPIRTFWMLHRNVDRLQAESDQRQVLVALHAFNGGEGLSDLMKKFQERIGRVVETQNDPVIEDNMPKLDEVGLMSLKGLGSL